MKRPLRNRIKRIAACLLPKTRWADALIAIPQYIQRHRRFPRLHIPRLFNEHLLKIKLDGTLQDPLRQYVTDKEYVKQYIAASVGHEYILETYNILRNEREAIGHKVIQVPCVVKPTHMSGEVLFHFNIGDSLEPTTVTRWLRTNHYDLSREPNYRFLEPKIILEELFSPDGKTPPNDYKVFCFFGIPRFIQVDSDRFTRHTRNFYDTQWNRLRFEINYPARKDDDIMPPKLHEILDIAGELSRPFSSIRVDLYAIGDAIKVGELTSCHESAGGLVQPRSAERWLGHFFTDTGLSVVAESLSQLRGDKRRA